MKKEKTMKKVLVLICAVLFLMMNCAPTIEKIQPVELSFKIDFSKYSDNNFLITPLKYNGDYKSIGLVQVIAYQGAKLDKMLRNKNSVPSWRKDKLDLKKYIESLYQMSVEMGADAIIEFHVTELEKNLAINTLYPVDILGYKLTGFAIKRKGAFK